jgi:hypothetical protein
MKTTEKARELVRKSNVELNGDYYDFIEHVSHRVEKVNAEQLARSLCYIVELEDTDDDGADDLGCSMSGGHPHMPADWKLPKNFKGYKFYLQLNLTELKKSDVDGLFPSTGMLYWFQHEHEGNCQLVYLSAPGKLVIRKDISGIEDEAPTKLAFKPGWLFYAGDGDAYDYSETAKAIPKTLRAELDKLFGCEMMEWSPTVRLFGRPLQWQGEDERYPDDEDSDDDDAPRESLLLLHTELDDASIHVWVAAEDLRNADFSKAWETFSTT